MMKSKVLVIGASGQIGIELVRSLRNKHGVNQVIASDLRKAPEYAKDDTFVEMDVLDKPELRSLFIKEKFTEVYLLAAMLSATGEKYPLNAWDLNIQSLLNILELGKEKLVAKIFWPSSIAVFGTNSPKFNTPQHCVMNPNTVYGISKLAGERWCEYYHEKYGVDVRSLRYPGLIGHQSEPGGGTTDYAVAIFHEAIAKASYSCYLHESRGLPMMYMSDAIDATMQIMAADAGDIKIRESYNVAGISFTPQGLANEIKKHIPAFEMTYNIDSRDKIALTWPTSIDESITTEHWGWKAKFDLPNMVKDMIDNLKKRQHNLAAEA